MKQNERTTSWVLLGIIVLLSLCLRLYDLGGESYWYDEIITMHVAQHDIWTIIEGGRPPLYLILAHFWIQLFGTEEVATRSLSALFGVASVFLIFLIGKKLFDTKAGLIGAFLMAISQFQIYYSQDFRYYSLFVLITLLSFYFFTLALRGRRVSNFILYVVCSILLFFTHAFGLFIIVAQGLYLLITWRSNRKLILYWVISQAAIFFAITPRILASLGKVVQGRAGSMNWLPEPSAWAPFLTFRNFVGSGLDYPSWETIIVGITFFVVATTAYVLWTGLAKWQANVGNNPSGFEGMASKGKELLMLLLWITIPTLLPLIISKIFGPMYHDRYIISASPALYIILAFFITRVGRVVPEIITLGLVAIIITPGLAEFYVNPVREQWREAAKYVQDNSRLDDVIIIAENGRDHNRHAFNWYYKGNLSECGINKHLKDHAAIRKEFVRCTKGMGRFWLVIREVPSPVPSFKEFFLNNGKKNIKLIMDRSFTKITVYLFEMT